MKTSGAKMKQILGVSSSSVFLGCGSSFASKANYPKQTQEQYKTRGHISYAILAFTWNLRTDIQIYDNSMLTWCWLFTLIAPVTRIKTNENNVQRRKMPSPDSLRVTLGQQQGRCSEKSTMEL